MNFRGGAQVGVVYNALSINKCAASIYLTSLNARTFIEVYINFHSLTIALLYWFDCIIMVYTGSTSE